jgi:hypothetical protein
MNKEEIFTYLKDLRDSCAINMFGAGSYLEDDFGLTRREAKEVLLEWFESFKTQEKTTC